MKYKRNFITDKSYLKLINSFYRMNKSFMGCFTYSRCGYVFREDLKFVIQKINNSYLDVFSKYM